MDRACPINESASTSVFLLDPDGYHIDRAQGQRAPSLAILAGT